MAKILLVDYNESVRNMWSYVIRRAGHMIVPVGKISQAIEEMSNFKFDLIICGATVEKPHDGLKLTNMLHAQNKLVLVISGEIGARAPGVEWLKKPVSSEALLNKINQMLDLPASNS